MKVDIRCDCSGPSWSLSNVIFSGLFFISNESLLSRIAREKTSFRLFRAEKTGFKSESDSENEVVRLSGGVEGPSLCKTARNLLAGDALSSSAVLEAASELSAVAFSAARREKRNMCNYIQESKQNCREKTVGGRMLKRPKAALRLDHICSGACTPYQLSPCWLISTTRAIQRCVVQPSLGYRAKSSMAGPVRLINADIPHKMVTVVQPDGKLAQTPVRLASLLHDIDQSTQFIELLTEKPRPIVKIRDKKEVREKEKQLKEKRASSRTVVKEIKVSWVISSGDLSHKLSQMRQNLSRGYKVAATFTPKPGQPPPPATECNQLVDRVVRELKDVATPQRIVNEGKGIMAYTTAYFISRQKGEPLDRTKNPARRERNPDGQPSETPSI